MSLACLCFFQNAMAARWARGIYLTQSSLNNTKKLKYFIAKSKLVGINTFVIDYQYRNKRYKPNIRLVKRNGIKYVARIVVFPNGGSRKQVHSRAFWEKKLRLVKGALAAGAEVILQEALVLNSLEEAVADCAVVFGASVRPRGLGMPPLTAREAGLRITMEAKTQKVALVFGREHAGLTNEELKNCHFHVYIPASIGYSSLNLAQAVQVLCYELRMALLTETESSFVPKMIEYAKTEDVENFYQHMETTLADIEFYKPIYSKRLIPRLRRMFNRIRLEKMEVNILRGILTAINNKLGN